MTTQDTGEPKGRRRRAGRIAVQLDTTAIRKRPALPNRSQNRLARETGGSPGYVSLLVNAGRVPSGRICRRMQKALDVDDLHEHFRAEERDEQH